MKFNLKTKQNSFNNSLSFNYSLNVNDSLFSVLRAVKIPCVFIRGLAKSAAYEVGDRTVDNLGNSWTAVFVSGGWRFVFPLWAFSAIVGHSTGTWTLVESDGKICGYVTCITKHSICNKTDLKVDRNCLLCEQVYFENQLQISKICNTQQGCSNYLGIDLTFSRGLDNK